MKVICIIPARFAAQRLPGKPLRKIAGFPMIEWVYKRASKTKLFDSIIVATDDIRIYKFIESIGGQVQMTPSELRSGTDRVAHVANDLDADVVVNLQGDEPLIEPQVLNLVCQPFHDPDVVMTTPITNIKSVEDLKDRTLARVVIDINGDAIYFTRAAIPYYRDSERYDDWLDHHTYFKQIGLYGYRKDFLLKLTTLPLGKLEKAEKLEQLRVLENGYKIRTVYTDYSSICVDTEDDLENIEKYIAKNQIKVDDVNAKM